MKKLCLGFLAMTISTTVFATATFITEAKIVDIEEVWRTAKIKKYSDCRDVISGTKTSTLCDTIEWITINKSIDFYRVTYDLFGKNFILKHKKRPVGITRDFTVSVYPYN
jgi:hypothetical protein